MTRIGAFTPETARDLLQAVQALRSSGWLVPGAVHSLLQSLPLLQPRRIYVLNDSDDDVPPYGCMQVTGTVELDGQNYLLVDIPADTDGTSGNYLFNDHELIEPGQEGVAQSGTVNLRAFVDTQSITAGTKYRPTVNQWYLTEDAAGQFLGNGPDDIGVGVGKISLLSPRGSGAEQIQGPLVDLETAPSTSPYSGLKIGTIEVELAPCSQSGLIGTEVEVVDWSACVFDRVLSELDGVWVWALTNGIAESRASGAAPGELTPCHITAWDRCCVPEDYA